MRYSIVSPGVGMKQLEGWKNPDGLNLGIYVFVYAYKVHIMMMIAFVMTLGNVIIAFGTLSSFLT